MRTPVHHLTPPALALACRMARDVLATPAVWTADTPNDRLTRLEAWRLLLHARGRRMNEGPLRRTLGLPARDPVEHRVAAHLAARMRPEEDPTPPAAA